MTVKQALNKAITILQGTSSPALDAEVLLSFVTEKNRGQILRDNIAELSQIQQKRFFSLTKKRVAGEPIAYLTGNKEFYGYDFIVNKNVLIPRPETEHLVELAINHLKTFSKVKNKTRILDVGTGSGCIIISIAKLLQATSHKLQVIYTATDISKKALTVARINAKRHKVKVKFIQSDLFANIKGRFDMILANLPYVTLEEYEEEKSIRQEPKIALLGQGKNWMIYKDFIDQIPQYMSKNAVAVIEINPKAINSLKKIFQQTGFKHSFLKDYSGKTRFAVLS